MVEYMCLVKKFVSVSFGGKVLLIKLVYVDIKTSKLYTVKGVSSKTLVTGLV